MLDIPGWEQQILNLKPKVELTFEADSSRYAYWIVLEGYACATVEAVSIDLEPGQIVCIAPHSFARIYNRGAKNLRVLMTSMEIMKKKG